MFPGSYNKEIQRYAESDRFQEQEYHYLSDKDSEFSGDSEDGEKIFPTQEYNEICSENLDFKDQNLNIYYNYNISDSLKSNFILSCKSAIGSSVY